MPGSKRRPNHEGTYEQLPSGKWRLSTKVNGKPVKGPAKATKKEARSALLAKLATGEKGAATDHTLSIWLTNSLARHKTPSTHAVYTAWVNGIKRDPIGDRRISTLTEADLRAWARRQSFGKTTLSKRFAWLVGELRAAGNDLKIPPRKMPRPDTNPRRPLLPSEQAEFRRMMETLDEPLRLAILIAWETGLRRSEILGLRHEDRIDDGIIPTLATTIGIDAVHTRRRKKTLRSESWIPLSSRLLALIGPPRTGFVVGDGETPMNPKTLSDQLWRLKQRYPFLQRIPRFGLHVFRRTFSMTILETGADYQTTGELMRDDPQTVAREYARSRLDLKRQAIDRAFPAEEPTQRHHEA